MYFRESDSEGMLVLQLLQYNRATVWSPTLFHFQVSWELGCWRKTELERGVWLLLKETNMAGSFSDVDNVHEPFEGCPYLFEQGERERVGGRGGREEGESGAQSRGGTMSCWRVESETSHWVKCFQTLAATAAWTIYWTDFKSTFHLHTHV